MQFKIVLISIDGLLPEYYLNAHSPAGETLHALALNGTCALRAEAVYPTLSMTNHATIATGVYSDRHGVVANTRFEPQAVDHWVGGESKAWFMNASDLRAPALWDLAAKAGKSAALLRWPVTRGARANWVIPDVFAVREGDPSTAELTVQASTPELVHTLIRERGPLKNGDNHWEMDAWVTHAATLLLDRSSPDLLMIHYNSHDHEVHAHGRDSPEAHRAIRYLESRVSHVLEHVDLSTTCVVILGDHGYFDFNRRIHLNALFQSQGWLEAKDDRILSWRAIAHTNCGQAGIHLQDPSLGPEVEALLNAHALGRYRILNRRELDALHACSGAYCAVDCLEGFSMGQNLSGPWVEEIGHVRGEHGFHPQLPAMGTGFIALGAGIPRGHRLECVRLIDVAPTLAQWMGLKMAGCDGVPIGLEEDLESFRPAHGSTG